MSALAAMLPDGRRLHLQHGPIDLIVEAFGPAGEVAEAYRQAASRFATVLEELVAELPVLRTPCGAAAPRLDGPVARRMEEAARPHLPGFITPMAAVAGAVADEALAALIAGRRLDRAYVNNGGDIALHLSQGTSLTAAVAARAGVPDRVGIGWESPVRGIATSGWRGRSRSFGIADAVTVIARTAAMADAAATLIANAVDLPGHPAIRRAPAASLDPDSDLGQRLVTVAVGTLAAAEIAAALGAGRRVAEAMRRRGLIEGAALFLAGDAETVRSGYAPAPLMEAEDA